MCSLRWGLCTQVFTSLHMGRMIVLLCVCNACANTCPGVCPGTRACGRKARYE